MLVSTDETFVRDVVENGIATTVRNRAVVLVFDSTNWNQAQTVFVAAANDSQEEGKRVVAVSHSVQAVVTHAAAAPAADQAATVAAYDGIKVKNVLVTVIDNDRAGILLTEVRKDAYDNGTLVLEGPAPYGITDSYTIELTKAPTAPVTIQLNYDHRQLQLSQDSVTFDASNWDQPVTIDIIARDDTLREDQKLSLITHTVSSSTDAAYFAAGASTVSETLAVTVADNDVPGVLVQQSNGSTLVTAGSSPVSDTYAVRLNSAPTGTVTITPLSDGTTTASTLSFDASNWWIPQIVTVAAVDIIDPNSPLLHPGTKQFAVQPHLLSDIKGPLEIEGGTGGAVHPLIAGVVLPGETNAAVLPIAVQPPEGQSIDILNVFDDSSQEDKQGVLTGTQLTGFGLSAGLHFDQAALGENADFAAGITYGKDDKSNIEVFNLLMGSGNDSLNIDSTLQTTAAHGGLTTIHGGGNLAVQASVAGAYTGTIDGDSITVTGGGGPTSPLVIYGDTSQDASWYAGRPYDADPADTLVLGPNPSQADAFYRLPRANPFDYAGNDVLDASAAKPATGSTLGADALGIVIYGGAGNDTIVGTQLGDVLAGGSGDDTISGQAGDDQIYGDSGVNVDIISRVLSVPTTDAARPANDNAGSNRDGLVAGEDSMFGGDDNDILFGDHGIVTQALPPEQKILNVRSIQNLRTDQPLNGADDVVYGNQGFDRIFGGNGNDTLYGADPGASADASNIILGDQGYIDYVKRDGDRGDIDEIASAVSADLSDAAIGGADLIVALGGDDIVLGGTAGDSIQAGAGRNLVIGDNGRIVAAVADAPRFGAQPLTLGVVETLAFGVGGADSILTLSGRDIILGGHEGDTIIASDLANPSTDDDNIVFGDDGRIVYDADGDPADIDLIESLADPGRRRCRHHRHRRR